MLGVVASVSRLVTYIIYAVSKDYRLLLVVYAYPPVNGSRYYLLPSGNNPGNLECDCNSVMYKYEVQTSRRGSSVDLLFAKSHHGVCFMSRG